MRKNFGSKPWIYPEPVLIIGTYDENNKPNAMNAAWGGIYDYDKLEINLSEHKTTENLRINKAFTVSIATLSTVTVSDFVGIVSGSDDPDKMKKANLHDVKSEFVNAPLFTEYPLTFECEMVSLGDDLRLVGKIINVSVDESILTNGKIDPSKLEAISFDPVNNKYLLVKEVVGNAFKDGLKLK
ncbi:MAG: flavin reductase [Acholeplasmatales bacterium]|nr:flavin reductase [Acholeplasmatales bacterium]